MALKPRSLPQGIDGDLAQRVSSQGLKLLINGEETPAMSGRTFGSVDPFSGANWYEAADAGTEDIDLAVRSATDAQQAWSKVPAYNRAKILLKIADAVEADAESIGVLDTLDNGKLLRETRAQASGVAHSLRYSAGNAETVEGITAPTSKHNTLGLTVREPYGVIGCMVPWNSPVPLMIDTAAPALAAGNAVVVKTPEDAPASILHFAKLAVENGLPPGILNVVSGKGAEAGEALVKHPGIAKLVFVGGGVVGRRVAAAAAERLIPVMLELGGKSPQIVLSDANLDNVIPGLISGVIAAAGQTCVAGSRALIHESIYEEVLDAFARRVDQLNYGDPLIATTEIGPLASARQLENALRHVDNAQADGARLIAGGGLRDTGVSSGRFFEPAIFADVRPDHRLFQTEVFGPIIGFTPFSNIDEALELANDSAFGLASGLWTQNIDTALTLARQIKAGTVWVNTYRAPEQSISSGGYKESGYGRIGGSRELYEFTREKTLIINHSGVVNDPFVMGG